MLSANISEQTFDKHPEKVGERCVSEKNSQDAVECRYTCPSVRVVVKHVILKGENLLDLKVRNRKKMIYEYTRYQKDIF